MTKFLCDISVIIDYVENFFSDQERDSGRLIDLAVVQKLKENTLLILPTGTVEKLSKLYPQRQLVLDTVYDASIALLVPDSDGKDDVSDLTRAYVLLKITDDETYIVCQDDYKRRMIERENDSIKIISIKEAVDILKEIS